MLMNAQKTKIQIKTLVSSIIMSGDLSEEYFQNRDNYYEKLSRKAVEENQKLYTYTDVYVTMEAVILEKEVDLFGFVPGVILEDENNILEYFITTFDDIQDLEYNTREQHISILKALAYMYCMNNGLSNTKVKLKYYNIETDESKSFIFEYSIDQLERFFMYIIGIFEEHEYIHLKHYLKFSSSREKFEFPFSKYRKGQEFVTNKALDSLNENKILYVNAPTGIGKSASFLYSGVKSMTRNSDKLFFLTSKSNGNRVAIETLGTFEKTGLFCNKMEIIAKHKICPLPKVKCHKDHCKYAKGFFDRLIDAKMYLFASRNNFYRKDIEEASEKFTVCPFELSLFMSYYSEVIICDYNYAFDPKAQLKRYFDDTNYRPKLLVDEAHNLVQRSLSMYSTSIDTDFYLRLKLIINRFSGNSVIVINKIVTLMNEHQLDMNLHENFCSSKTMDYDLMELNRELQIKLRNLMYKHQNFEDRDEVVESYYVINDLLSIAEFYNESYVTTYERFHSNIKMTLQCLDASRYLSIVLENKAYGTILFSGSLRPINYYKNLITMGNGKSIGVASPFDNKKLSVIISKNVNTRYKERDLFIGDIVTQIELLASSKKGNYIAFFPSYNYMQSVVDRVNHKKYDIIIQCKGDDYLRKNEIMQQFETVGNRSKIGFFVLGGSYSEAIDFRGNMLIGVAVIGVGLPKLSPMNELYKEYLGMKYKNGFDYAYTYPGFNKIIQAVGRLIRTKEDEGIALLIGERYGQYRYQKLMPKLWKPNRISNSNDELAIILNEIVDK